jgi:hypothetical protein
VFDYVVDRDPMNVDCKRAIAQQTKWTGRVYPPRALNLFDRVCGLSKQVFVTQKQDCKGLAD